MNPIPRRRIPLLIGLALLGAPAAALAQPPGIAHRNAGVARGLQLAIEAGFPDDAVTVGTAFGATAAVGVGVVGLTATVTTWEADYGFGAEPSREFGYGATANLRLFGGPLVPLSITLQAGAARWTETILIDDIVWDETITTVPVGLGFALTIPSPILSLKPWLAPRIQWTERSEVGRRSDPALSGGIDLGFINGASLRGAYDRIFTDGGDRTVWSVGIAHSLRMGR